MGKSLPSTDMDTGKHRQIWSRTNKEADIHGHAQTQMQTQTARQTDVGIERYGGDLQYDLLSGADSDSYNRQVWDRRQNRGQGDKVENSDLGCLS